MGWTASIEATPERLGAELDALELPDRRAERDQVKAAIAAVKKLAPLASKRERILASINVHDDPDGDGFNGRLVAVSVSRVDPEAVRQREEAERAERERLERIENESAEGDAAPAPDERPDA